jgi:trehalose/maltose hydrolase-like predicted phosphorylase
VPITPDGLLEQFEGYTKLKELDWEHYRRTYGNIHRMDRILKSEGDSPDKFKVAKQADALMPFYVLTPDDVLRVLRNLGYSITDRAAFLKRNYDFYEAHTSHGSTLSKIVHAAISRDMGSERMWDWFLEALQSDIRDTQGGTTQEGIHTGVMAGSIDIITRVIAGVSVGRGHLGVGANLPAHWRSLAFKLRLRDRWYSFKLSRDTVRVRVGAGTGKPLKVRVRKL